MIKAALLDLEHLNRLQINFFTIAPKISFNPPRVNVDFLPCESRLQMAV